VRRPPRGAAGPLGGGGASCLYKGHLNIYLLNLLMFSLQFIVPDIRLPGLHVRLIFI
jgi:hypothetical protein